MSDFSDLSDDEILAAINHQPKNNENSQISDSELLNTLQTANPDFGRTYPFSILPISKNLTGVNELDSNAGIIGAIKKPIVDFTSVIRNGASPFVYDENGERNLDPKITEASLGVASLISPVNPAIRAGQNMLGGSALVKQQPKTPTQEELFNAGSKAYKNARELGVDYNSNSIKNIADILKNGLNDEGILAELAPKSHSIVEQLRTPPKDSVMSLSSLEAARRGFSNAAKDFNNPTEQLASSRAIKSIDDFIQSASKSDVVQGDAKTAAQIMQEARGNWGAAARSENLTNRQYAADLNTAAANSGQNLDNTLRRQAASALKQPKEIAGYSPEEITSLEQVVQGTPLRNTLRTFGSMAGGGGGIGTTIGVGAGAGVGSFFGMPFVGAAAVPAAGFAAKGTSNKMTQNALNRVEEQVRQRSPLYQQLLQDSPMVAKNQINETALSKLLLSHALQQRTQVQNGR